MTLLNIRNLTVKFATATGSFTAVDGIDVRVDRGEVLAIVGESGSGKSVSMLAVMGLLPDTATITADEMTYDGRDISNLSGAERRKLIGREITMIFQEPIASLNPSFTVGYQIEEVLRLNLGLSKRAAHDRALDLFRAVGIPEPEVKIKAYPHQMSGGQCQRVMIAMAIASNPRLLIADEPTTALDVTIQKQILDLLMKLQEDYGMALILITHDMGVVAETADRVVVQYKGKKMEEADVLSLFEAPQHPYTRALLAALPEHATGDRLPTVSDFFQQAGLLFKFDFPFLLLHLLLFLQLALALLRPFAHLVLKALPLFVDHALAFQLHILLLTLKLFFAAQEGQFFLAGFLQLGFAVFFALLQEAEAGLVFRCYLLAQLLLQHQLALFAGVFYLALQLGGKALLLLLQFLFAAENFIFFGF